MTRQTIIAIEKDKYNPSLDLAFKMARIFGVKIEDIFVYDEELLDPEERGGSGRGGAPLPS